MPSPAYGIDYGPQPPSDFGALLILQGSAPPGPYYGEPGTADAQDLTLAAGLAKAAASAAAAGVTTEPPPSTPPPPPTPFEPPPPPLPTEPPTAQPPALEPPPEPPPEPFRPRGPPASGGTSVESYGQQVRRVLRDTAIRKGAPRVVPNIIEGELVGETVGGIVTRAILGPIGAIIGGILSPSDIAPGTRFPPYTLPDIPNPIPAPEPPVFVIPEAPIPYTPPELGRPTPPDVVVVEAPAPNPPAMPTPGTPSSVSATPWWLGPAIIAGTVLAPRLTPRRRGIPLPPGAPFTWPIATPGAAVSVGPSTPPIPVTPVAPSTPFQPLPLPSFPGAPAPSISASATPSPTFGPPLTPLKAPTVESAPKCETPQERKDRQKKRRDSCRKLVSIKVRAHYRKVCLSQAIEHEIAKERRKLVREYITKPAGEAGKRATDWVLEHVGLTPYAKQAKAVRKRVRELTRKEKPVTIPGTDIRINPEALLRRKP